MAKSNVEYKTNGYYIRVNGKTVSGVFINVSKESNSLQKWKISLEDLLTKLGDNDFEIIASGTGGDDSPF